MLNNMNAHFQPRPKLTLMMASLNQDIGQCAYSSIMGMKRRHELTLAELKDDETHPITVFRAGTRLNRRLFEPAVNCQLQQFLKILTIHHSYGVDDEHVS